MYALHAHRNGVRTSLLCTRWRYVQAKSKEIDFHFPFFIVALYFMCVRTLKYMILVVVVTVVARAAAAPIDITGIHARVPFYLRGGRGEDMQAEGDRPGALKDRLLSSCRKVLRRHRQTGAVQIRTI